ncbi:hypothetical protein [Kitasatospora griseola]|uniref:hypothetical protein n=1 Tax=Kitasatospora griseola TaxID=2064 RepID=UPI0037F98557
MTEDRRITGGLHISGNAQVTISGGAIAAGQDSSATVHTSAVDEESVVRRVLALVEQLRQSPDPEAVRAAEDLQQVVVEPVRRWDQVLRFLSRAGQGVAATTAIAAEIQGLDEAVRALLP